MAGVFVRLKLALLGNSFRSSPGSLVLYLLGTVVALGAGALAGWGLAQHLGEPGRTGQALLMAVALAVFLTWVVGPVLNIQQGDQTTDPSRLELLPLSAHQQIVGVTAAGLVGPAAVGTLLGALGPAFAGGTGIVAAGFIAVAALLLVVLCVTWSRAVAAALAGLVDSRRGKEFTVVLASAVAVVMVLVSSSIGRATESVLGSNSGGGTWDALAVLPPAALGWSMAAARADQWPLACCLLAWGVVGVGLAVLLWRWALARRLRGDGSGARTATTAGAVSLFPGWASALPRTALGATAAKELRYHLFRSTLQLQQLVFGAVLALIFAGQSLVDAEPGGLSLFLGATVVFFIMFQTAPNLFGIDNAAVSTYLLTGVDLGRVVVGKMLALLLIALPLGLVAQVAVTAAHGRWSELPVGLAALPVPWLVWLGLGPLLSVKAPFPVSMGKSGNSGKAMASVFGGLIVASVVLVALIAAAALAASAAGTPWAGVAIGWSVGAAVGAGGLHLARRDLAARPTQLLARLDHA